MTHEKDGIAPRIMREKEETVLDELGLSRDLTFVDEEGTVK
jgi:hypothetical protein